MRNINNLALFISILCLVSDPDYGDDNNFGYEYPLVVTFIYQEHAEIGGVSVGRIEDYKVPHESLCPADDECAYA